MFLKLYRLLLKKDCNLFQKFHVLTYVIFDLHYFSVKFPENLQLHEIKV